MLFSYPLYWYSKLQSEIALSTTEAEYITMSQALCNVIPLVNLMNKLLSTMDINHIQSIMKCRVYKDNQSTITIAKAPSMLPRTKHIRLKYHHFRQFVKQGLITLQYVSSEEQIGDMFTKPLPPSSFTYLRYKLMGW